MIKTDDINLDEIWDRINDKVEKTSKRIGPTFPHSSENGQYDTMPINQWTNGFWSGLLWQLSINDNEEFRSIAVQCEEKLDEALFDNIVHHDVGFIWLLTSVLNYKTTGKERSRTRALIAAEKLAGRFNLKGQFIRAWNEKEGLNTTGWSIIDTMMNLSLLYWASEETLDPRFKHIAVAHTNTVLEKFLRPDGSVYHILSFDPENGNLVEPLGGQGAFPESAWARGSAWTIYGLTNGYNHTGNPDYLNGAKKAANYFISHLPNDFVPYWDFRAERKTSTPRDSSAAACAASGLIDLAHAVRKEESYVYLEVALKILKSLDTNYGTWEDENEEGLILKGTSSVPDNRYIDKPLIYGDYYFVEAIAKLKGHNISVW